MITKKRLRICELARVVLISLFLSGLWGDSFITKYEYGEYLYDNPRGIGCNRCHGQKGEGKLIAKYFDEEDKEVELKGGNIQKVALQKLYKALQNPPTVMPKYNLTDQEIEALHIFLNEVN
jgi:cytochrome c553